MGPGTHLANRFKRGDLGINLDFLKARFKFLLLRWVFGKRTASFLAGGVMGRGGGRVVVRDIQSGNALSWDLSSRETSSRQCEANPWLGNSLALN